MNLHRHIQLLLYDYVRGALSEDDRKSADDHLRSCPQCAEALRQLQSTTRVLSRRTVPPSEERPPEYWSTFAKHVIDRIPPERGRRQTHPLHIGERVRALYAFHRGWLALGGCAVAAAVVTVMIWRGQAPPQPVTFPEELRGNAVAVERTDTEMTQYLRRSKALLIGLSNMNKEDAQSADLSIERETSRDLVKEARALRRQPLDPRSARLVGDLEKILIELSNCKIRNAAPQVRIIREGIQRRNLLFKVRMAEAAYNSRMFKLASQKEGGQ